MATRAPKKSMIESCGQQRSQIWDRSPHLKDTKILKEESRARGSLGKEEGSIMILRV